MKIKWDEAAKNSLHEIIAYIKKDSVQNAENVKQTILKAIREIPSHPERYPADKFKKTITEAIVPLKYTTYALLIKQKAMRLKLSE
ncbi:MAG TPA: type II toxin-antitoxin system RelE/ParE family toxin [Candidatus Babeliaceae bacterium]|nr:type II toxin-antitoxin system RelE/ParE family toxin [Candidatus Babeliaceae bacterium]